MFRDNLLVPSSSFKQSKKHVGNRWMHYCAGDDVSCDCFLGAVRDCSTLQDGLDRLS